MRKTPPNDWDKWIAVIVTAVGLAIVLYFGYQTITFLLRHPWLLVAIIVGAFALLAKRFMR